MTLLLNKLLSLFLSPLGASLLMGTAALIMSLVKWRRTGHVLLACALLTLWIAATPVFAYWISWNVASQIPYTHYEAPPEHDAIILLGGTPLSRILHARWLYGAGEAPYIFITGGNPPWQDAEIPEAQRVADLLSKLGVPRSALVIEPASRTTRENAVNTAAIFKKRRWRNGILVTSSTHMPRAFAAFENTGLKVRPAPTDTPPSPIKIDSVLDILPDAEALAKTTAATKELVGFWFYRLKGWA